jgi:hypothetical protein
MFSRQTEVMQPPEKKTGQSAICTFKAILLKYMLKTEVDKKKVRRGKACSQRVDSMDKQYTQKTGTSQCAAYDAAYSKYVMAVVHSMSCRMLTIGDGG